MIGDRYGITSGMKEEIWETEKSGIIRLKEKDGSIMLSDKWKAGNEV